MRLPDCRFIDLQYGDTRADREAIEADFGVKVERMPDVDNTNDIDGLAALITACDVVVTTSNTTAHLAGALGKETYILVPSGRGRMWYWFRGREDSPFYPRVRLKRQRPKQHWAELPAVSRRSSRRGEKVGATIPAAPGARRRAAPARSDAGASAEKLCRSGTCLQ